MNKACYLLAVIFVIITIGVSGCLNQQKDRDILFQTSTIDALLKGAYDGNMNFKDLKQYGDFGIGTLNGLDGEMIALAGEFYQIKEDGKAYAVGGAMMTPFSIVTFFEPDKTFSLDKALSLEQLEQYLDNVLPIKNIFYAVKIDGAFNYINARSVPKQEKPYPSLDEALKEQSTFEFCDVAGTIVGFWCPDYVEGLNVPGYHFHFITSDKKAGGHLLGCQTQNVRIEIDYTPEFFMKLPGGEEFNNLEVE